MTMRIILRVNVFCKYTSITFITIMIKIYFSLACIWKREGVFPAKISDLVQLTEDRPAGKVSTDYKTFKISELLNHSHYNSFQMKCTDCKIIPVLD